MQAHDWLMIRVHSAWDSWHSAEVRLADLRDIHWSQPGHAPHRLLHAFVSCTALTSGDLAHTCDPGSAPHALLVCVLKRHAIPEAYSTLVQRADSGRTAAVIEPTVRPTKRFFRLFS